MAILRMEDGTVHSDLTAIQRELDGIGVKLARWPTGSDPELVTLLGRPALAPEEKERVLTCLDSYFQRLKTEHGYQARDLVVLHPEVPGLDDLLAKFASCHFHTDDEVRYIVDGEGTFGFVRPDGSQMGLTVVAEEYINVPARAEHWFVLTAARRIKAVRYFTDTAGWVANYTGTPIRLGANP